MPASSSPRALDWRTASLLALPPVLWAGNAVVGRLLVGQFPPIALNWVRWIVAFALLAPVLIAWIRHHGHWPPAPWRVMVPIGLFGVGAYNALQYLALQTSSPVNTTLIAASAPAWVLAIGALFFHERVGARQWLGASVSIAGVLCVLTRGDPGRLGTLSFVAGDLYMLAATLCWGFYTWLLRRRRPELPGMVFLALQIIYGTMLSVPFVSIEAMTSPVTMHWTPAVLAALVYFAVGPSILAYVCWDHGVARAGASIPVFFANLTPLFATIFSAALLGEAAHAYHAAAFALILAGIALAMMHTARH